MQDSGSYVSILVGPTSSKNIFLSAGLGTSGLSQRSIDGGLTWAQMFVQGVMAFHPTIPNVMYAITQSNLFVSSDSGLTWGSVAAPVNFLEDPTVLPSGNVVISTYGNGVIEFTPN
jgi:hypothetical protein